MNSSASSPPHSLFALQGAVIDRKEEINLTPLRPDQQSFYRSQILQSEIGVNPLVASAAPLLLLQRRLIEQHEIENDGQLYQLLVHEVLAFETAARQVHYGSEVIVMSRFFLLTMLEESIQKHTQLAGLWPKWHLLKTFQNIETPHQQFFSLLEKLARDPDVYIDQLELVYLILKQGYQGEDQTSPPSSLPLAKITDDLYQIIKSQRPYLTSLFSNEDKTVLIQKKLWRKRFSIIKTVYFTIFGLSIAFLAYLGIMHYAIQPLKTNLAKLEKTLEHSSH